MRILIINTSENTGGAAVATGRLTEALNNNGIKTQMLVREKSTDSSFVVTLPHKHLTKWHFVLERFAVYVNLCFSKNHLWEIDIASAGTDITNLPEFKYADVVHLSWINQGMLSLNGIKKIIESGKPIVWTMHDLWPASSICHYARGCENFINGCNNCKLLPNGGGKKDLSYKVWQKKKEIYSHSDIHFVTCSRWLENQAKQSGLLYGLSLTAIPNPIDTNVFRPIDKEKSKQRLGISPDKKIVLFAAQKVTDERKGARYLIDAINNISSLDTETTKNIEVALLGGNADELASQLQLPSHNLGYISGDSNLAAIYNAADVFVLPSMEDNLPNTLMEALACGVPCAGFNVGGIPEMIDHKINGYVAEAGNAEDLANGLRWILTEADNKQLSHNAVEKVNREYSQASVAARYVEVYSNAISRKKKKDI